MDLDTREADESLERFRASRTAEGRFLTYCRGRSRHFLTRQLIVLMLIPIFWFAAGPQLALLAACASVAGETLDSLVLRRIGQHTALGERLALDMGVSTLTGGLQALSNAFGITVFYMAGGGDARTLAGAACFAGILDAALLFTAHRGASVIRIVVYILTVSVISFQEWLHYGVNRSLLFDCMGMALLLAVCWLLVRHVFATQQRRNLNRLDTLKKTQELAHANVALEQSRKMTRRLAMVAERANDSVIITDGEGIVTWVNRAFSEVTGYSFAEAVGRNVSFLDGPQTDTKSSDELHRARSDLRSVRLEIVTHHKDGHPIWMETNMCPLLDGEGGLLNIVSIDRDIGEAKERERALADARQVAEDAVQARRSFLATMSHEIRTPMNGVIGTTDLLLETELDPQQQALARTINSSGEALLAIINDILDFSKLEAGRFEVSAEPFSPVDCFRSVVNLVKPLAKNKRLQLDLVLPSSLPPFVVGDGRRLAQVLLNLLGNAIKFTDSGKVGVEVSVRLESGKCLFLISVRDTGIGIPPDQLDRIFESFTQADTKIAGRFGGTGLGLSISKLLVNAMGGEISAASKPGEGSVFFVSLALSEAEAPPMVPLTSSDVSSLATPGTDLGALRVLVAEDNRTNTLLIERMLNGTGVETIFATNGREAVEIFETAAPDIVLMDLHMPILDGIAATRQIREIEAHTSTPAVPVIALTANAFPEDKDLCLEAGMNGLVTKPFRKRDLIGALSEFSDRRFADDSVDGPSRKARHTA